jgi:hypothetical protein
MLHLVSAMEEDPAKAYKTVRGELEAYGHGLAEKPEIVALSQIDTADAKTISEKAKASEKGRRQGAAAVFLGQPRRPRRGAARPDGAYRGKARSRDRAEPDPRWQD